MEEKIEVLCGLCGEKIKRPKGTREGELSPQEKLGVHKSCVDKHTEIMKKHNLSPNIETITLLRGLIELHPEVEQSKAVFDYRNRQDMAREELYKEFPGLEDKKE